AGPTLLVTDLAIWKPDPLTKEFTVASLHPGVTREQVSGTCGWQAKFADHVEATPAPTELELRTLRELNARTATARVAPGTGSVSRNR
ncbi:MAG: CoA-transferase subunit beta, partial [Pseudomonadota bacterium]|nr:CoA-transferase subunit beta [Pseudomonadota bacterium]